MKVVWEGEKGLDESGLGMKVFFWMRVVGMKLVLDESGFGMKEVVFDEKNGMESDSFIPIWMKVYLTIPNINGTNAQLQPQRLKCIQVRRCQKPAQRATPTCIR